MKAISKKFVIGASMLLSLTLAFALAPLISPYKYDEQNLQERLLPPDSRHIFGTDHFGRDVFTRILYGGKVSFLIASLVTLLALTIGLLVGVVSGYCGRIVDEVLMRFTDIFLSLPSLVVSLAIIAAIGPSIQNLALALSITGWPKYARMIRASIIEVKNKDFILLTSLMGADSFYLIFKHIVPNTIQPAIVLASFDFGRKVISIASIGFLGAGVQPPTPEWGTMIREGFSYVFTSPHLVLIPGMMATITLIASNLLGEGLQDMLMRKPAIRI
jgi:peptide/nickel transport system permease protein